MRLRRCNEKIKYIPRRIILGAGMSEIISFIVKSCETQIPTLVFFLVNTCRQYRV
jgi:hypothetical protein